MLLYSLESSEYIVLIKSYKSATKIIHNNDRIRLQEIITILLEKV